MQVAREKIFSLLSGWLPELDKSVAAQLLYIAGAWGLMTRDQQITAIPSKLKLPQLSPNLEILSLLAPMWLTTVCVLGDEADKVAALISQKMQIKPHLSLVQGADIVILLHSMDFLPTAQRAQYLANVVACLSARGRLIVLQWDTSSPPVYAALDILCTLRGKRLCPGATPSPTGMYLETYTLPKADLAFWQIWSFSPTASPLLTYVDGTEWEARRTDIYAEIVETRSLCPSAPKRFRIEDAFLQPGAQQLDYWVQSGEAVDFVSVKWGQMKLFGATLFCLVKIWDWSLGPPTVVYAGAAEGWNIEVLSWMFPQIRWILYDTREFEIGLGRADPSSLWGGDKGFGRGGSARRVEEGEKGGGLEIHSGPINGLFTDEVAAKYTSMPNILFMSDIRYRKEEADVLADHARQAKWLFIISPVLSILKFRPPYPDDDDDDTSKAFSYLPGEVLFQPYSNRISSETRLLVWGVPSANVEYNLREYDREISFHNLVTRHCTRWEVGERVVDFDFAHVLFSLQSYLELTDQTADVFELFDKVVQWLNVYKVVPFSIEEERTKQRKR